MDEPDKAATFVECLKLGMDIEEIAEELHMTVEELLEFGSNVLHEEEKGQRA